MTFQPRRIVTGHDAEGRSIVAIDGTPPVRREVPKRGVSYFELWNTNEMPAVVSARQDEPTGRHMQVPPMPNGTVIRMNEWQPGFAHAERHMHRTETIDYGIVLEGEMVLYLDDREVPLKTGDVVIQRGTDHAWVNKSDKVARMLFVLVDGQFDEGLRTMFGDTTRILRDTWSGAAPDAGVVTPAPGAQK